jgi:hypothetical protein
LASIYVELVNSLIRVEGQEDWVKNNNAKSSNTFSHRSHYGVEKVGRLALESLGVGYDYKGKSNL